MNPPRHRPRRTDDGFTLIEVLVAMLVLSGALLGLAGAFGAAMQQVAGSTPMLIAREKAREAVESVHAARDAGELSWATVFNDTTAGGIFRTGAQPLRLPGTDGLVNTADDGAVETTRSPGNDGILNTADDEVLPLTNFTREIVITPVNMPAGGPDPTLRQVTVNVRYLVGGIWRTYSLTTYISSYS